jgi:Zn-dependent protease with chaperone function
LKYCNRCGGNLGALTQAPAQDLRQPVQPGTAWAVGTTMMLLVALGLGLTFAVARDLSHSPAAPGTLMLVVLLGVATTFGSVFLLTRFWMWLLGGGVRRAGADPTLEELRPGARPSHTNELDPARHRALPENPFPSITEQTTRTLDSINRKS